MHLPDFVSGLLRCSAEAAALALLVLVLQKLFHRRLAPSWRCALWLIVAARLLIPVSFSTAASLYNLAPRASTDTPPVTASEQTNPALTGIAPPLFPPPDQAIATPPDSAAVPASSIANEPAPATSAAFASADAATLNLRTPDPDPAAPANTVSHLARWSAWIFGVWLAGVAAMCAGVWSGSRTLARRFRQARPVTAPDVLALFEDCRRRLRIRPSLAIHECDRVTSPVLHGCLRPRLLLPAGFIRRFSTDDLRYVFLHELAHVKRRDLPVNWLLALLQVAHWFNPLVWFAFARWRAEREMACDALAIEAAGNGQNRAYGEAILRILENFVPQTMAPGLVGILEDKRQLRQRIAMIAAWAPRRRLSLLALFLLAGLALVGLTDAQVPAREISNENSPDSVSAILTAPAHPESFSAQSVTEKNIRQITFTVLDAETGLPIKDARIIAGWAFQASEKKAFTTDERGQVQVIVPLKRSAALLLPDMTSHLSYYISHPDYSGRYAAWNSGGRIQDARLAPPDSWTIRLPRGITIGGIVRDARGTPIAGARITASGFSSLSDPVIKDERSNYRESSGTGDPWNLNTSPPVITDEAGHWSIPHYPSDVSNIRVSVRHPLGAPFFFASNPEFAGWTPGGTLAHDDLIAQRAVITLPDGIALHGLVTDGNGKPLDSVSLKIRYASGSNDDVHDFTSGSDGRFTLTGWQPAPLFIAAMHEGFAGTVIAVIPEPDAQKIPEIHIIMQPAKTLRLRVVDDTGAPLVASVRIAWQNEDSANMLIPLKGSQSDITTDTGGVIIWDDAPIGEIPVNIRSDGYTEQTFLFIADGTEHLVRLAKETTPPRSQPAHDIPVTLRVLDEETGHPLDEFEVWTTREHARKTWPSSCQFGTKGEFKTTLPSPLPSRISYSSIILELRAPGYKEWTSPRIRPDAPAQVFDVRMKRRSAATEAIATPLPARPLALTDEQRRHLNAIAGNIRDLLATGDLDIFLRAATPVASDWAYLKPESRNHPDPERLQQEIRSSAQTFLALARRMGTWPSDPADIRIRNISVENAGISYYGSQDGPRFPKCNDVKLVLAVAPSPADAPPGPRIPGGEYTIDLGDVFVFPTTARLDDGLRWNGLPAGVGDLALRREISLARNVGTSIADPRPLSIADDEALADFAEIFADLLRHRDVARWERAALPDPKKQWKGLASGATTSMRDVLSRFEKLGIDPQQSTLRVRQVTALTPTLNNLGSLDGLMAKLMRITFTVTTAQTTPAGRPLAGDYVLTSGHSSRYDGRWYLFDTVVRWMAFPDGVLDTQEAALMRLEDHVADHGVLPAGMTAPNVKLFPLASGKAETWLSAWRGKLVFIEWWNSSFERSMKRLDGLQQMMEQHPEWSDDVAIVSINVDDDPAEARNQIDIRRWTRIENLWAGSGDYSKREAIRQFHLQSYPNPYWVDRNGIILAAGGPLADDTPGVVENLIATQLQKKDLE
ncbi:antirepressor regulating drug resistance protein [Opitutaceae bacterium TAV1]|nr:antirepressor regulating drug resistance protein [Opitutaceae bacterium TAV1]